MPARREGETQSSQLEVVAAFYRAFNDGEFAAAAEWLSEDFEWRPAFGRSLLGGNAYTGRRGFLQYCADIGESFSGYRSELLGLEPAGRASVLAHVRASGAGRTSGIAVDREFWILYELHDGTLVTGETFADRIEALRRAVGL